MHTSTKAEFFAAVRSHDLGRVASLLATEPSLANARIRGDSTLLNEQVWENGQIVDIPPHDTREGMALHFAALHGDTELARLLLAHGADVNAIAYENNMDMTTPVVIAAWEGGIPMLRLLLDHGADPNTRCSQGDTPISVAARHGKFDRVDLLKQYGATE